MPMFTFAPARKVTASLAGAAAMLLASGAHAQPRPTNSSPPPPPRVYAPAPAPRVNTPPPAPPRQVVPPSVPRHVTPPSPPPRQPDLVPRYVPTPRDTVIVPETPKPVQPPRNEFRAAPIPHPEQPGVGFQGRRGRNEFEGQVRQGPAGPEGEISITTPNPLSEPKKQ